jgi:transcriptional regulator GlxA family with amidase domain
MAVDKSTARRALLDGHRVATHWDACAPFAEPFPLSLLILMPFMSWTDGCGLQPA